MGLQVIAVDGKTARGARRGDGRAVHLFAALSQDTSVVLEQCALDPKTNEINTFGPLLDRLNITGAIINADALHTQRAHVTYLSEHGAHSIFIIAKDNQPRLHRQLASVPWKQVPLADPTTSKSHGRVETRTVKLVAVTAGFEFPHVALTIQITLSL